MQAILTRPLKDNDGWHHAGEKIRLKKEEFERLLKIGAVVQPFDGSEENEKEAKE